MLVLAVLAALEGWLERLHTSMLSLASLLDELVLLAGGPCVLIEVSDIHMLATKGSQFDVNSNATPRQDIFDA